MNKRRSFNHIKALKLIDGLWCYDEDKIKLEVVDFFRRLYTEDGMVVDRFSVKDLFPCIESSQVALLTRDVSV